MLIEAALVLEMQRTNPRVNTRTAHKYAEWVLEESTQHVLDPWLIFSLVYVESRWTAVVVRPEGDGSCSVGLGQMNVATCDPIEIERLVDPRENLRRVGHRLALLRRVCKNDCEGIRWLRGYNPGSKSYVSKVEGVLARAHAEYEPPLREVPTDLYASWMCREDDRGASAECGVAAWRTCSRGPVEPVLCEVPQMSQVHDAGVRVPSPSSGDAAARVHSNPDKIDFVAPGWTGPIWHCSELAVLLQRSPAGMEWCRYDIDVAFLGQVPALLLGQGLGVSELFPRDGYFMMEEVACPGPFFFLSGKPSLLAGPARLLGIRLGRVVTPLPGATTEQLIGHMVEQLLAAR